MSSSGVFSKTLILKQNLRRAAKTSRELEHLPCEHRLRVRVVQPREEKAPEGILEQPSRGGYRESNDKKSKGFKPREGQIRYRKEIVYGEGGEVHYRQNRLSGYAVAAPPLKVFKASLDRA